MSAVTDFAKAFERCPLVAILRGVLPGEVEEIGDTLVDAGFSIIEVPLNSPDPFDSISRLARRYDDRVLIGAGTVLTVEQVGAVAEAGGRLIVSPNTDAAVIGATVAACMISVPGYYTVTEAFAALNAGAHALKIFPAEVAGPAMVKSQRAVLPRGIPLVASGGVEPSTLSAWRAAGADGFGLGSSLYRAGSSSTEVRERAGRFLEALQEAR